MIVRKQQNYDQNSAIKELNLISEGETAFLQDWTAARMSSCQKLSLGEDSPTLNSYSKRYQFASQRNINQIVVPRKTNINFRRRNISRINNKNQVKQDDIFAPKYKKFDNITLKQKSKQNNGMQKLQKLKQQHKYMIVTQFQQLIQKPKQIIKKIDDNKDTANKNSQLNQSNTFQYLLKLKNQSMRYLKIQQQKKATIQQSITTRQTKQKKQARRINQVIKNKIRRKRTNKFLFIKQINQSTIPQRDTKKYEQSVKKIAIIKKGMEQNTARSSQIKLLKNWLDTNRYRQKRSFGSLLKEHLNTKSFELHRQKQKAALAKSVKFISLLINSSKNIL